MKINRLEITNNLNNYTDNKYNFNVIYNGISEYGNLIIFDTSDYYGNNTYLVFSPLVFDYMNDNKIIKMVLDVLDNIFKGNTKKSCKCFV